MRIRKIDQTIEQATEIAPTCAAAAAFLGWTGDVMKVNVTDSPDDSEGWDAWGVTIDGELVAYTDGPLLAV